MGTLASKEVIHEDQRHSILCSCRDFVTTYPHFWASILSTQRKVVILICTVLLSPGSLIPQVPDYLDWSYSLAIELIENIIFVLIHAFFVKFINFSVLFFPKAGMSGKNFLLWNRACFSLIVTALLHVSI